MPRLQRSPHHAQRRRPWQRRLGLRARVTAIFGLGALALSAAMAGATYFAARHTSLGQQEDAARTQAYDNAAFIHEQLSGHAGAPTTSDIINALTQVRAPDSRSYLEEAGQWYSPDIPLPIVPAGISGSLRQLVIVRDLPASQLVRVNGTPELAIGIPVPSLQVAYFELYSLDELSRTLGVLAGTLALVGLVMTVLGVVAGRLASARALRPLATVSHAAETIAGGRLHTRLSARDDADLGALAASFNRMADALEERIERETRFTSDVSHELRSPLTTLSASLGVLDSYREFVPPRGRRALELLGLEVRRFQRMVDDLLEISRVDSGAAELSLDEVEVGELMRRVARTTGVARVPLDIDPSVDHRHLQVDKRRIERIVANLVENAAQYAGGVTRLAAEPAPGAVRLVVADHGPGVAPEERERVFERFYRGHASGKRGTGAGTGLGLSLVAEHVRLHGGRVWVESASGENRFVVELPVSPNGWRAPEDSEPAAHGDAGVPR